MKFLDKYAGYFALRIMTVMGRVLLPRAAKENDPKTFKKILLIKFWGMGSILLLSPTVKEIRRQLPASRLIMLSTSRNREICESIGLFDEILLLEVDKGWFTFARSLGAIIYKLALARYDMVIDFEFFTRFSAMITFFTFARLRIGYHAWESWRGDIHNIKVPFNRYWHVMDNFFNLTNYFLQPVTAELSMAKPFIPDSDKAYVDSLLADRKITDKIISLHVNASDLVIERRWPYENFISLSKRLLDRYPDISLAFIGSEPEKGSVSKIISAIDNERAVDLVPKLSLRQLAYLLQRSILVIANDSGPLHLAEAMGTPTVSFFGPETPVMYGPKGTANTVLFHNIDCSPCINVHDRKSVHCRFEKPRCITMIGIEEALNAVQHRLSSALKSGTPS